MKYNEILNVDEGIFKKKRLLNNLGDLKKDLPIFINLENILNSTIPEFVNVSQKIGLFYEDLLNLYALVKEHGENSKIVEAFMSGLNWKEGKNAKGFFGLSKKIGGGKSAGRIRKLNLAKGIGNVLEEILKKMKDNNMNFVRIYNFFPNVVDNIDIDVLSDILLKLLEEEFTLFTKRMVEELKVDERHLSSNGLVYLPIQKMEKEEFIYPLEFFSTFSPIVDERDFNALKNKSNSFKAFAEIFKNHKNKFIEKISGKNYIFINDLLDYRFIVSHFLTKNDKYKENKEILRNGYELFNKMKSSSKKIENNLENHIDEIINNGIYLNSILFNNKNGYIKLQETEIQKWLFVGLKLLYKSSVSQHNSHYPYGIDDIFVFEHKKDGSIFKNLIELKILNDKNKISKIIKNYKYQMNFYNQGEVYDKNFFIVYVNNLSKDDIKKFINLMNEVKNEKINIKFKIVIVSKPITGSKANARFDPVIKIIEKFEDVDKLEIRNEYVKKIIELKKEYFEIVGEWINSVDIDFVEQEIIINKRYQNDLIKKINEINKDFSNNSNNNIYQLKEILKQNIEK